jgi:hypothetical protein
MSAWTEGGRHPVETEPGEALSLYDITCAAPADVPIPAGDMEPLPDATSPGNPDTTTPCGGTAPHARNRRSE